ncbi:MAG: multidrug transporter MurJ, partial [Rickettsiaceae bacterium]|nr:multidrug transporter MurJ [Rickettsiaceae bacterium]
MLLRSGIIVAFFTLLSRFFGLAREFFIAATFGTSALADCVNVAFKFPNLFRRIFGEGALSAVFIPMFSERLVTSRDEAKIFSGKIFTLLMITLIILTIIVEILMSYIVLLIAPGFYLENEKFELAVILCRITTPYLIFVSITALFGGMLNSVKKFAAFAFVPIIMNISVIVVTY